ncbi:MAG TPA: hypothetical protein ENJ37_02435 [Deltaproteobacteria bacterium]|nr:hypothetical protein [Deltaproteobacteria bacterium]
MELAAAFLVPALLGCAVVCLLARRKNIHIWAVPYLKGLAAKRPPREGPVHVMLAVVDHYEPYWNGASASTARRRVERWVREYPAVASRFADSAGNRPRHTCFYPEEEYDGAIMDMLAGLRDGGFVDVEIHLHHDGDSAEELREKLLRFKSTLHERHGLLRRGNDGDLLYGFIHGNWALCNSRRDGRWCGVDNELVVLRETGCYADFTLPSAPSETQTSKINSIYYARDIPGRPKSHDRGVDVEAGLAPSGDLMIVQGPLTLDWRRRKWGLAPRIENGDLSFDNPPAPRRARLWVECNIHVRGRPRWIFVKVHTHGCQEDNMEMLLDGGGLASLYRCMEDGYNDGERFRLHYVSAWEMYNIIKAAEAGEDGDPSSLRTYLTERG